MKEYMASLTSLRGLAALLVVFSHLTDYGFSFTDRLSGIGQVGVSVFFSLSGFLMGYIYLGKSFSGSQGIKYTISRFSRIAPAYLFVVLLSYVFFNFVDSNFPIAINNDNLFRHLIFSGNASILWSIPPEVQFYAVFFVFWFSLALVKVGNYALVTFLLMVFILSVAYKDFFPGVIVFSKLLCFLLGSFFGWIRYIYKDSFFYNRVSAYFQLGFFVWALCLFVLENTYSGYEVYWKDLFNSIWPAFLVFCFSYDNKNICRFINIKPFRLLGEWSFSLYLTHVFIIYYMSIVLPLDIFGSFLVVVIAILFSSVFYYLIEKPGIVVFKRFLERIVRLKKISLG